MGPAVVVVPVVVVPAFVAGVKVGVHVASRVIRGRGSATPVVRCSECGNDHDETSGDKCQLCSNPKGNENPPL